MKGTSGRKRRVPTATTVAADSASNSKDVENTTLRTAGGIIASSRRTLFVVSERPKNRINPRTKSGTMT